MAGLGRITIPLPGNANLPGQPTAFQVHPEDSTWFPCPYRARSALRAPASAWYLPEPCLTELCWMGSQGWKKGEGSSGAGALWPVSWFDVSLEWRPVFRRLIWKGWACVACSADSPPTGPGHSLAEAASFKGQQGGGGAGPPRSPAKRPLVLKVAFEGTVLNHKHS